MTIVERVDAEVRLEIPKYKKKDPNYSSYVSHEMPVEAIDLKILEDYLFNLRCRGAADDSKIKFEIDRMVWNGTKHEAKVVALTSKASATMDGFSMLPAPVEKKPVVKKFDVHSAVAVGLFLATFVLFLLTLLV